MARLLNSLSRIYRRLSPTRRVLVRIEDQLAQLEGLVVERGHDHLQTMQERLAENRAHLERLEKQLSSDLQPLARVNEIENALLRRFDEQLLELGRVRAESSEQLGHFRAEVKGTLQPLENLEMFHNSLLRRFDEQLLELGRVRAESAGGFDTVASQLSAQLQQFGAQDWVSQLRDGVSRLDNGLADIRERLTQLDAAQKNTSQEVSAGLSGATRAVATEAHSLADRLSDLKKELSLLEVSLSRTLQAHLDKTRQDVVGKLDKASDAMQGVSKEVATTNKRKSQELQTILALQEHLVSTGLNLTSGPKDLPDLRNIAMAIENGDAALDPDHHSVAFMGHPLVFDDLFSVYVVYKEIYLYEDYYAELGTQTPRIIDGGAHIGMSALYFKDRYPLAEVLCFEPDPRNFDLLSQNTAHLSDGITRYNLAITDDGADYPLMRRQGQSMASSIYSRYSKINNDDGLVTKSVRLSTFLAERVDLLKLDIEGPEDMVLQECRHLLQNVHYIFIEFHTGDQLPLSRLTTILGILDEAGFTYQIERAREYQVRMMHKPFTHLNQLCTHVIHAKNRNFAK